MPRQDPNKPEDTPKVKEQQLKASEGEKKIIKEKPKEVEPSGFEQKGDLIEKVRKSFRDEAKEKYELEAFANLYAELEFLDGYREKLIDLMKSEANEMAQAFNKKWSKDWELFHEVYKHATLVRIALQSNELTGDANVVQEIREKAFKASEPIVIIYDKAIVEQNTEKYLEELRAAVLEFKKFDLMLIAKGHDPNRQAKQIEMLMFSKDKDQPDEKIKKEVDAAMNLSIADQDKAIQLIDIIYRCTQNLGSVDKKALNQAWRDLIYAAVNLESLVNRNQFMSSFKFSLPEKFQSFGSDFSSGLQYIFKAVEVVNKDAKMKEDRVSIVLSGIRAMRQALVDNKGPKTTP